MIEVASFVVLAVLIAGWLDMLWPWDWKGNRKRKDEDASD